MNRKWFPQGGSPSVLGLEVSAGLALPHKPSAFVSEARPLPASPSPALWPGLSLMVRYEKSIRVFPLPTVDHWP